MTIYYENAPIEPLSAAEEADAALDVASAVESPFANIAALPLGSLVTIELPQEAVAPLLQNRATTAGSSGS